MVITTQAPSPGYYGTIFHYRAIPCMRAHVKRHLPTRYYGREGCPEHVFSEALPLSRERSYDILVCLIQNLILSEKPKAQSD